MATASAFWELGSSLETEGLFLAAWTGGGWQAVGCGDAQEFDGGKLEGEFLVAFAADVGC